jgi:ribosomal protein L40E
MLPNPHFSPNPVVKSKGARVPATVSVAASTNTLPSSSKAAVSRANGSASSGVTGASTGLNVASNPPKPRKKKSTALPAGHSVFSASTMAPYQPVAQPTPRAPPGAPPLAKPSGLALQSVGRAVGPPAAASASNGKHRAPSGLHTGPLPQVTGGVSIARASTSGLQSLPAPRAAAPTASRPSALPVVTSSSSPPPVNQLFSSTSAQAPSTSTNKRPATSQPEEARKKRMISVCLICNARPGMRATSFPACRY